MSMSITFREDSLQAVQDSVSFQKPLMILITDSSADSEAWVAARFTSANTALSHFTMRSLAEDFIQLKIIENSSDFENLSQFLPVIKKTSQPSLLFIYFGKVIQTITSECAPEDIDSFIRTMKENLQVYRSNFLSQQHPQPTEPPQPTPSPQPTDHPVTPSDTAPLRTEPSSSHDNATQAKEVKIANQSAKKTFKEEAAEMAARHYKDKLLKQQRQAKEDKARILKLMKLDREEQRQRQRQLAESCKLSSKNENPHENIQNFKLRTQDQYTLQLKLFDGTTIRRTFERNNKLADVRKFLLELKPEYNDAPFYFFKMVDRITYGDADEINTLENLDLNMSTLILKPGEIVGEKHEIQSNPQGTLTWLKNKMNNLLWTPKPTYQTLPAQYSDDATNSGVRSLLSTSSAQVNTIRTTTPPLRTASPAYFDRCAADESEEEGGSVYHSPQLSSVSSSSHITGPGSLRHNVSNFSLYGSSGLIPSQPPSSLKNECDPEVDERSSRYCKVQNLDSDDVESIGNGNSIALQRNEDD